MVLVFVGIVVFVLLELGVLVGTPLGFWFGVVFGGFVQPRIFYAHSMPHSRQGMELPSGVHMRW